MKARTALLVAAAALAAGCHARRPPGAVPPSPPPPPPGHVLLVPATGSPEPARFCVTVDGPGGRGREGACADPGGRALLRAPARDFVLRVTVRPASGAARPAGGRWPEIVGGAARGEVLLVAPRLASPVLLETRTRLLRGEEAARAAGESFAPAPPPLEIGEPDALSVTGLER